MNRRRFLQTTTALTLASQLPNTEIFAANPAKVGNLGVALFTLPKSLSQDFEGTLKMISDMGFSELEFFDPYDYSGEAAKKQWEMAAKALGFSGSGYFGKSPKELKALLKKYKLSSPAIHVDLPTLRENMAGVAEAADVIGHKYVGIAMIPDDMRKTLDDYKRTADIFNEVGKSAKKYGLTFFYHNHGYGHKPVEGTIPFQLILDNTDPDLVKMEMDVFWFSAAGINPVDYLKNNPGRFPLLHVKDMSEKKTFAKDGSNMGEWMGMFPYLADAGAGVLDLETILCEAKKAGAKHFFLEKDNTPNPQQALQASYDFLSKVKC